MDRGDSVQIAKRRDSLSAQGGLPAHARSYVNLFTVRTRQTPDFIASLPPATAWYDKLVRKHDMVIAGPSKVVPRFINSLVIGFGSTFSRCCSAR